MSYDPTRIDHSELDRHIAGYWGEDGVAEDDFDDAAECFVCGLIHDDPGYGELKQRADGWSYHDQCWKEHQTVAAWKKSAATPGQ